MEIAPTLTLRRIRPHKNERRFYRMEITADLFGTILLMRNWGRIGTDGRRRFYVFADADAAEAELVRLAASKRRRGYREVLPKSQ
jgi:predicted DNA-binding WGR domain protein